MCGVFGICAGHGVDVANLTGDVEGDVVGEFCNFALANTAARTKQQQA